MSLRKWVVPLVLLATPANALAQGPIEWASTLKRHAAALAHDSMEGRAPGSAGGGRAARYIAARFRAAGLEPPPDQASYLQPVPLRGVTPIRGTVTVGASVLRQGADVWLRSERVDAAVGFASGVVFAGYGIDAAPYGWDDYAGTDVQGKIVLILPGVAEALAARLPGGSNAFAAEFAHKIAAARRRGARGILLLSDPADDAGSFRGRRAKWTIEWPRADWGDGHRLEVIGVLSPAGSGMVLDALGETFPALATTARTPTFRARPLGSAFTIALEQRARRFSAPNVVGVRWGTDPDAGTVVVTAHYDAYGLGPADASGDSIYNGAADNAAGTAAIITLAEVLVADPRPLPRTVVFVATTAEEADFDHIGARYYVERGAVGTPAFNLNIDGVSTLAPTHDYALFPTAGSGVAEEIDEVARQFGLSRSVRSWHPGMHFSFDSMEFLARGIPGVTLWWGGDPTISPDAVRARRDGAPQGGIHVPSDEYWDGWQEDAIAQHLALYYEVLRYFAHRPEQPAMPDVHPFVLIDRNGN